MSRKVKKAPSGTQAWTPRRIGICATQLFLYCFLAYACSYVGRKNFSACIPAMIEEGFLLKSFGGYVTTAYMLVYGTGQIVSGLLAARIKPRYMIALGVLGAGLCNLLMGMTPTPYPMIAIWACNGFFHSMLWSPIIRTFTDLLPSERRSAAGTNIAASCSVGAILAFLIPGIILRFGDWRTVFFVSGGILLACFAVWVTGNRILNGYIAHMEEICAEERRTASPTVEAVDSSGSHSRSGLLTLFIGGGLWVVLFGLVCNGALRDAVETWAPSFLSERFGLDSSLSALLSVAIPLISISGTYAANFLHERVFRNELIAAAVTFAVAALCVGGLFLCRYMPLPALSAVLSALFMAVSVAAMWGTNHLFLTVIPYRFASVGLSASVTGILNSVIYFATALCSGLYGVLADVVGWDVLILIWLGIGVLGVATCLAGAGIWGKRLR